MHAVYHVPHRPNVAKGDTVCVTATHDEHSMWFACAPDGHGDPAHQGDSAPMCTCDMHNTFSRINMARFNDPLTRRRLYDSALRTVHAMPANGHVLCIGECSLLPVIVALIVRDTEHRVTVVDGNSHSRRYVERFFAANGLADRATILPAIDNVTDVDAVLMEPNYQTSLLPWHNLRALYELNAVRDKSPSIMTNVTMGKLRCLPVYLHELYKIRAPVLNVMGYDVSEFDHIVQVR